MNFVSKLSEWIRLPVTTRAVSTHPTTYDPEIRLIEDRQRDIQARLNLLDSYASILDRNIRDKT